MSLSDLGRPWPILSEGLNAPEGLAVDWLSDNMYWTDSGRKVSQEEVAIRAYTTSGSDDTMNKI